jgi:ferredoxin-NADP reductase
MGQSTSFLTRLLAEENLATCGLRFSSRSVADIIYREELKRLGSAPGGPAIVHTLTHERPPPGWRGHARLIDAPMLAEVGLPASAHTGFDPASSPWMRRLTMPRDGRPVSRFWITMGLSGA